MDWQIGVFTAVAIFLGKVGGTALNKAFKNTSVNSSIETQQPFELPLDETREVDIVKLAEERKGKRNPLLMSLPKINKWGLVVYVIAFTSISVFLVQWKNVTNIMGFFGIVIYVMLLASFPLVMVQIFVAIVKFAGNALKSSKGFAEMMKHLFNKKTLLITYGASILYVCIFHVPWRGGRNIEHPTAYFLGYSPIWDAPQRIAKVDFGVVLMELFAVTVVAVVVFYLLSDNKKT